MSTVDVGDSARMKCDSCGRFFRYQEPGSSWLFVPDSYVSREEIGDYCAACTAIHGAPRAMQNVNHAMCSGIVPETVEERGNDPTD